MLKLVRKSQSDFKKVLNRRLEITFNKAISEIKEHILMTYDIELTGAVTDLKAKTNPALYKEEFAERLDSYEYIRMTGGTLTLMVPDIESFDFSGRLKVLETIMEGVIGNYVEINEEDYVKVFNKKPVNEDPVDKYVPKKDRIYILKYNNTLKSAEKNVLKKKLVKYPFSNSPPVDIFEQANKFVDDNIDNWIQSAIEEANKEFISLIKGAS